MSVTNPDERPDQWSELRFVTPGLAAEWLDQSNVGNRSISRIHVARWKTRYDLGRYRLHHQGIAFDREGLLLDGQHRLTGLTASQIGGVWMQVTYNVDRASFDVLDMPYVRGASQLIPGPHAPVKAAAVRMLIDSYPQLRPSSSRQVEPQQVVNLYYQIEGSVEEAARLAAAVYSATRISTSLHAALLTVLLEADHDRARLADWLKGLTTGAGLPADDPRLALRNRWAIEGSRLSRSAQGGWDGAYLLVRAWNAFARGESLKKIPLPNSHTDFPEVVL